MEKMLQDPFLRELCREQVPVSIFLVNGVKLHGRVVNFDQSVLLLQNSVCQLVYKHAVSTIVPAASVSIPPLED